MIGSALMTLSFMSLKNTLLQAGMQILLIEERSA